MMSSWRFRENNISVFHWFLVEYTNSQTPFRGRIKAKFSATPSSQICPLHTSRNTYIHTETTLMYQTLPTLLLYPRHNQTGEHQTFVNSSLSRSSNAASEKPSVFERCIIQEDSTPQNIGLPVPSEQHLNTKLHRPLHSKQNQTCEHEHDALTHQQRNKLISLQVATCRKPANKVYNTIVPYQLSFPNASPPHQCSMYVHTIDVPHTLLANSNNA